LLHLSARLDSHILIEGETIPLLRASPQSFLCVLHRLLRRLRLLLLSLLLKQQLSDCIEALIRLLLLALNLGKLAVELSLHVLNWTIITLRLDGAWFRLYDIASGRFWLLYVLVRLDHVILS